MAVVEVDFSGTDAEGVWSVNIDGYGVAEAVVCGFCCVGSPKARLR